MIDINKKYRTRDGREARVICTDALGAMPVVANIRLSETTEQVVQYTIHGRYYLGGRESCRDLIEVREPRVIWVNESEEDMDSYYTIAEAEKWANAHTIRIAVKYIEAIES